jgi:hypothetical protein
LVVKTLGVALRVKVDEVARASAEVRVLLLKSLATSVRAQIDECRAGFPFGAFSVQVTLLVLKELSQEGECGGGRHVFGRHFRGGWATADGDGGQG